MLPAIMFLLLQSKPVRPCAPRKFCHEVICFRPLTKHHCNDEDYKSVGCNSCNTIHHHHQQQQQPTNNVFQGHNTKMGKRKRKRQNKETNNAQVRNSYLKLSLQQSTFQSLHDLVRTTKRQWDSSQERQDQKTRSKKQSKRQLTIKPRTLKSLHMTYFFCAKVLDEMPCEELRLWNSMVRERLLQYESSCPADSEYTLKFKSLALFPPNRHNLIVAMFEASHKLHCLYQELCNLAMSEKQTLADGESKFLFPLLADLTRSRHENRKQNENSSPWVAHVTLGNISGGNKDDVRRLKSWLDNYDYQQSDVLQLGSEISVDGLEFGGPLPPQIELNWDYLFMHPAAATSSDGG